MTALRQVQNAGYWVGRDAKQASYIDTADDPTTADVTEVLTLTRIDIAVWDDQDMFIDEHKFVYTLQDGRLERDYYIKEYTDTEFEFEANTFIADYITYFEYNQGSNTLTVTATTSGYRTVTIETRTYEIDLRPDTIYWQE
jgi:hypothetical protein